MYIAESFWNKDWYHQAHPHPCPSPAKRARETRFSIWNTELPANMGRDRLRASFRSAVPRRKGWDSNPRALLGRRLSKPPLLPFQPPFRVQQGPTGGERGSRTPKGVTPDSFRDRRRRQSACLSEHSDEPDLLLRGCSGSVPGRPRRAEFASLRFEPAFSVLPLDDRSHVDCSVGSGASATSQFREITSAAIREPSASAVVKWLTRGSNPDSDGFKPSPSAGWGSEPGRGLPITA